MAKANIVIVFVPGGAGTALALDTMSFWNVPPPDFSGLRLILDPALALPWSPSDVGNLVNVYDNFIEAFLVGSLGYSINSDLFLFPYDWRQGFPSAGISLANLVNSTIVPQLGGRKIVFICHSYGCMVARWALTMPSPISPIDPALVNSVVAAGPHMLGIPQAFSNFQSMPQISDAFTFLYNLAVFLFPEFVDQIQVPINRTLMAVDAQLYCLPDYGILTNIANITAPYSPFLWNHWPTQTSALMTQIRNNLDSLAIAAWPASVPRIVIASQSFPTEAGYLLDANGKIISPVMQMGDNTVPIDSALAYCDPGQQFLVNSQHRELLDNPNGRTYLVSTANVI
jgi:pimeloyl-ACP methyl ester carboxylesterase